MLAVMETHKPRDFNIKPSKFVEPEDKSLYVQENNLNRFGHTITLINKSNAMLFGGAIGSNFNYKLMNDAFLFDCKNKKWIVLNQSGDIPTLRAAHCAVSNMNSDLFIFGGVTYDGQKSNNELYYVENISYKETCNWNTIETEGARPCSRYGHSLIIVKDYLLLFGGQGDTLMNDIWLIKVENKTGTWLSLKVKGDSPPCRLYHQMALCTEGHSKGMLTLFGGRNENFEGLNDLWGLRSHRNGTWDWIKAPSYKNKRAIPRYQHTMHFIGNFLILIGGKRNEKDSDEMPIEIYDMNTTKWTKHELMNRYRQCSWIVDNDLYLHGGFSLEDKIEPKEDFILIDVFKFIDMNSDLLEAFSKNLDDCNSTTLVNKFNTFLTQSSFNSNKENIDDLFVEPGNSSLNTNPRKSQLFKRRYVLDQPLLSSIKQPNNDQNGRVSLGEVRISKVKIEIVKKSEDDSDLTQRSSNLLSIRKSDISESNSNTELCDVFIKNILQPNTWKNFKKEFAPKFEFTTMQVLTLIDQCLQVIKGEKKILRVKTPVKVFGDIHGQIKDLMKFFEKWGEPNEGINGDINNVDYLFLGDYVDRGKFSIDTICLLMALKIKYPKQIHMIRGNHEDRCVNDKFGFLGECKFRLEKSSYELIFQRFNEFFDWLPLAATIDNEILCVHGGIGANFDYLSDLENIERPIIVDHGPKSLNEQIIMDILWSDPTDNDTEIGITANPSRDPTKTSIVKFGPDIVEKFLEKNNLKMILRGHECVNDGFERFAGGKLITVFSATNYGGTHKNAGAMLLIKSNLEIIPFAIYPEEASNTTWIDDPEYLSRYPPTPPKQIRPLILKP